MPKIVDDLFDLWAGIDYIEIRATVEHPRVECALTGCAVPQIHSLGNCLDGTLFDLCHRVSRSTNRPFLRDSRTCERSGKYQPLLRICKAVATA